VDLPSVCACKIECVDRVKIKSSPVARGARTARTFTLLPCRNRYCPDDCFGEAQADLRFDMSANGTQAFWGASVPPLKNARPPTVGKTEPSIRMPGRQLSKKSTVISASLAPVATV
jgi:hypothetical protein